MTESPEMIRPDALTGDPVPPHLTPTERRLLETLQTRAGQVLSRTELVASVLEDTMASERTIDVHIRALRRKLGEHADLIETVRGVGYRFRDVEPALDDA